MKNSKRAERRRNNKRLVKKRFKQEVRTLYVTHDEDMEEHLHWCMVRARKRLDTSAKCSCRMCRNPRRTGGWASVTCDPRTFQELKSLDSMRDDMIEQ